GATNAAQGRRDVSVVVLLAQDFQEAPRIRIAYQGLLQTLAGEPEGGDLVGGPEGYRPAPPFQERRLADDISGGEGAHHHLPAAIAHEAFDGAGDDQEEERLAGALLGHHGLRLEADEQHGREQPLELVAGEVLHHRGRGQVVPQPLELHGRGSGLGAAGLAQTLEGEGAHVLHALVALDPLDLEADRLVEGGQLLRLGQEGDPLVVEAVLGVLVGDVAELVDRLVELAEPGVDLGELQMGMEVLRIELDPRLQALRGLVVLLEDDEVVDRVLLLLALLGLLLGAATEPAPDAHGMMPPGKSWERRPCDRGDAPDAWRGRSSSSKARPLYRDFFVVHPTTRWQGSCCTIEAREGSGRRSVQMFIRNALARRVGLALGVCALAALPASADNDNGYGYLRAVEGSATLVQAGSETQTPAELNQPVLVGDRLLVPARSRVEIVLADRNLLRIDGGSEVVLERLAGSPDSQDRGTVWRLIEGNLQPVVLRESLGDELPRIDA